MDRSNRLVRASVKLWGNSAWKYLISELLFVILKVTLPGGERSMSAQKSPNIQIEKLFPQLEELSRGFSNVIAAYLFGSQTSGRPTPLSDVDVGILMDDDLTDMESFRIEMSLLGKLQKIFGTENIDLVVLNKAPLPIQFSATSGRLLFTTNHEKRTNFEEYVRKYYIDCLPIYREYREEFLKRIREEGAQSG